MKSFTRNATTRGPIINYVNFFFFKSVPRTIPHCEFLFPSFLFQFFFEQVTKKKIYIYFFKSTLFPTKPFAKGRRYQTVTQTIIGHGTHKDRTGCSYTGLLEAFFTDSYRYTRIKRPRDKYQCSLGLPNIFVWENI